MPPPVHKSCKKEIPASYCCIPLSLCSIYNITPVFSLVKNYVKILKTDPSVLLLFH